MAVVESWREAEILRETYRAVLKGALRERGAEQQLATKLNVSKEYLSSVIGRHGESVPSINFIERLTEALPLDRDQRLRVKDYMIWSYERREQSLKSLQKYGDGVTEEELSLWRERVHEHLNSKVPTGMRHDSDWLSNLGKRLAPLVLKKSPLEAVEMYFLLAVVCLKDADQSLYFSKLGRFIFDKYEQVIRVHSKRHENILVNLAIVEASAYHHLGWYKESVRRRERIPWLIEQAGYDVNKWKPLFHRENIPSLIKLSRYSIRNIVKSVSESKIIIAEDRNSNTLLESFAIDRSLAGAFLHSGNSYKAEQAIQEYVSVPVDDWMCIHQVMLYRTIAQIRWQQKDRSISGEWAYFAKRAWMLADEAGFTNQLQGIRRNFGTAIDQLTGSEITYT